MKNDYLYQWCNNRCSLADWQVSNLFNATSRLFTSTQVLPATLLEPIHSLVVCHHWVGCNVPCRVFCSQDAWPWDGCFRLWIVGCFLGCNYTSVGDSDLLNPHDMVFELQWFVILLVLHVNMARNSASAQPVDFKYLDSRQYQFLSLALVERDLSSGFAGGSGIRETCHVLLLDRTRFP